MSASPSPLAGEGRGGGKRRAFTQRDAAGEASHGHALFRIPLVRADHILIRLDGFSLSSRVISSREPRATFSCPARRAKISSA